MATRDDEEFQRRVQDATRLRIAEILSAAGVGYNQISQEILYMLPREFMDRYSQLWETAMGPAGVC